MKKMLLLAGIATVAFAVNASACDWTPYVSAKVTASDLNFDRSSRWVQGGVATVINSAGDDSQHVWGTSFAAGIDGGAIRAELEWHRNTAGRYSNTWRDTAGWAISEKFKVKTDALMLNAYYDFDTGSAFTPYIGAGIGYAKTKVAYADNNFNINGFWKQTDSHTNIAWQIGAGIAYELNDNVSIDVGYRYVDYGKFDVLNTTAVAFGNITRDTYEVTANELYAGIRYSF